MLGTLRATNQKFNEQRTRELQAKRGLRPAGSRPNDLARLEADMAMKGWGSIHRGPSPDGPMQ